MEVNITARKLVVPVLVGLALVAGILVGRSSPAPAPARLDQRAPFGFSKVVFLSHVNTRSMPIFPGDPKVRLRPIFTVPDDGFRLQLMRIGEHTGTHWGSPCHFNLGEPCADELAARDFFLPAVVIDARRQTRRNVDYALTVRALRRFEARHGRIPKGAMVIMWTGFQGRWDKPKAYVNRKADGLLHYPGISKGATRWLIRQRDLRGLGIDTLGVDPGIDETFGTNTLLLRNHRIHLENLAHLGRMQPNGGWIVVGGVRNRRGSGSPTTVYGLVP